MRPSRLDHTFFQEEIRPHLGALMLRKGARSKLGISTPTAIAQAWRQIERLTRA